MYFEISTPKLVKIELEKPTRFFEIYRNGKKYYSRNFCTPQKKFEFNINDIGNFYSDNKGKYTFADRKIFSCKINQLPPIEKETPTAKVVAIFNPTLTGTPARIDVKQNPIRLEYSKEFLTYPKPIQDFILLHELGHHYYKTERYADQYALYHYINYQYGNPSQAFYALVNIFKNPEYQQERIKSILDKIKH